MAFDPNDSRITAYIFGELNDRDSTAFESEMASSDELREAVQQTRLAMELLANDLKHESPTSLSDDQRQTVEQAINQANTSGESPCVGSASRRPKRFLGFALLAAVAATILLALALPGYQYARRRSIAMQARNASSQSSRQAANARSAIEAADFQGHHDSYRALPVDEASAGSKESSSLSVATSPDGDDLAVAREVARLQQEVAQREQDQVRVVERRSKEAKTVASLLEQKAVSLQEEAHGAARNFSVARGEARVRLEAVEAKSKAVGDARGLDRATELALINERLSQAASVNSESLRPDDGTGPGFSGDQFSPIYENPFLRVDDQPLSTFSIDVDTASYAKVRMYLMQHGILPRPDSVRIEELVNYFTYDYAPPTDGSPFAAHVEVADCPWTQGHRLMRVGIKGRVIEKGQRPTSNLVFLLDVSGSMNRPNKLPLLKQGMKMLVDQLGENDRVAIVVYAGAAGLVLDSTPGDDKQVIVDALDRLHAGGSTNGGQGIQLAYQTALDNFVKGGVNRVILCSDGDFNVGVTGTDSLVRMAEENAKTGVFLSVLGFGMGNHNDAMLEEISNKGNGNYAFIDTEMEARKVLVEQMSGTLVTIAKDVKIQIEFNPSELAAYRLIGYENRILAAEDFNDDTKDAGEIGAGHTVTALYELVPEGMEDPVATGSSVDDLRYQKQPKPTKEAESGELALLKIRSKLPDADASTKQEFHIVDEGKKFGQTDKDFRFAAAVASFGMLLRNSQHKGSATYAGVREIATEAAEGDKSGYRDEFLNMVARAQELAGK